jgi:ABC-type spermidine/putrescine transport system permease subunit II
MHRKAVFVLAGVFLVVALIVPPVMLVLQSDNDLDNYIISQNPNGLQTNGNVTILTPDELKENHTNTFILVAIVEVIFVVLAVVTLYYGINHPHPEH